MLTNDDICIICSELLNISDGLKDKSFFAVTDEGEGLPLPFDKYLTAHDEQSLKTIMEQPCYVRSYSKNSRYTDNNVAYRLWVGDYASTDVFSELSEGKGIKRLGIIRADIDDLGKTFVSGFSETGGGKYETISRTSALSAKLSEFFKLRINYILSHGNFSVTGEKTGARNAAVVYSGGDDLFVVGRWDDIIGFAIDLHDSFERFSQGTLTISAGIGIFDDKFPIYAMADRTGALEDKAKRNKYNGKSKNSVALFDGDNVYTWDVLKNKVIGEKLDAVRELCSGDEHDTAMLYKMLDLIKSSEDKLNVARFAYLLARLRPKDSAKEKVKNRFSALSERLYRWIKSEEDRKQLITAIYIYVYCNRGNDDEDR